MSIAKVTASITAENNFTDWVTLDHEADLLISGIAGGTVVSVQSTPDDGVTVFPVDSYTVDTHKIIGPSNQNLKFRVGIATGDYGSGTTEVEISR